MRYTQLKTYIKKIEEDTVSEVMEIEKESFIDPWPEEGIIQELENPNSLCFMLYHPTELEPIGYIIGQVVLDEGHLLNFAVKKGYRRHGFGSVLLEYFEREAQRRGAKKVFLEVRMHNHTAQKFYMKHGYKMISVRPNYYKNGEDAIIMKKNLII